MGGAFMNTANVGGPQPIRPAATTPPPKPKAAAPKPQQTTPPPVAENRQARAKTEAKNTPPPKVAGEVNVTA
jgi:hypothetical protein